MARGTIDHGPPGCSHVRTYRSAAIAAFRGLIPRRRRLGGGVSLCRRPLLLPPPPPPRCPLVEPIFGRVWVGDEHAADLLPFRHPPGHFGGGQRGGDEVDARAEARGRADPACAGIIPEALVRVVRPAAVVDFALRLHHVGVEPIALR